MNTVHTKWLLYYWTSSFSDLGQCSRYDWQATAKKWSPSVQDARVCRLLWLLFTYSGCDTYSRATPGLLNACITVCDEFASWQLSVSRSSTQGRRPRGVQVGLCPPVFRTTVYTRLLPFSSQHFHAVATSCIVTFELFPTIGFRSLSFESRLNCDSKVAKGLMKANPWKVLVRGTF